MPFAQVLLRLSSLATSLVPAALPALSFDVARADEADAFARAAIGRWVSEDNSAVVELRPDGRYNEAEPNGTDWRHGRYELDCRTVYFESDSGHVAKGEISRGVLIVGGVPFRRTGSEARAQAALALN